MEFFRICVTVFYLLIICLLLLVVVYQQQKIRYLEKAHRQRTIALRIVTTVYLKGKYKAAVWTRRSSRRYLVEEHRKQKFWLN
jgi:hypothetical protein